MLTWVLQNSIYNCQNPDYLHRREEPGRHHLFCESNSFYDGGVRIPYVLQFSATSFRCTGAFAMDGLLLVVRKITRQKSSAASALRGHRGRHGVGFHLEASGSRLNCPLVINLSLRYSGSSTTDVTIRYATPSLSNRL